MRAISRRLFSAGGAAAGALAGPALAFGPAKTKRVDLPSDADLQKVLAERVEALSAGQDGIGMIAGVVGPWGQRVVSVGRRAKGDAHPLTGDTLFEFGSVTKVFTALVLADMVVRREVSLDDPVARYLPRSTALPKRNGKFITLIDLATHTSGLPFMPELPARADGATEAYTDADLFEFLAHFRLPRDIGSGWDYSNLGYWLLSQALAARAGETFETLLHSRVLIPLGLSRSGYSLSSEMKADQAIGHDASLRPSSSIHDTPIYDLMPAAGVGFWSTTNDALKFLSAALGYRHTALAPAFSMTLGIRRPIPGSSDIQALGWTLIGTGPDKLVFRDGGTWGFASCLVWERERRVGAVVLANCVTDVSDVARHVLRPDFPLKAPTTAIHTEIALDAGVLRQYAGKYEAPGEGVFAVALVDGYLTFEAPPDWGLPVFRIRPESAQDFFAAELPLHIKFQTAPGGSTVGMTIYPPRGQSGIQARKVG